MDGMEKNTVTLPQITLDTWRCATFAEPHRPTMGTVRRWVLTGRITPPPVKCGRTYYCDPGARYTDPRSPQPPAPTLRLIDRLRQQDNHATSTQG